MRILIVCSGNAPNFNFQKHQAFIYDQAEALKRVNTKLLIDYFFITGKGITGYLSCLGTLRDQLECHQYDLIHAHVALSGLLANLQRKVPVVTTFHGSDINVPTLRLASSVVDLLSSKTIYISKALAEKAFYAGKDKQTVIPCGVDFDLFTPRLKADSRKRLGLSVSKRFILFSSAFTVAVKNYPLARAAVDLVQDGSTELLELANYSRSEVALLFTAVDVALMTSFSEGSPQFIKEALACNCPVVSTDVGDVRLVMERIAGCYICSYEPADVADKLRKALALTSPIDARPHIQRFSNQLIAGQIHSIYQQLCTVER